MKFDTILAQYLYQHKKLNLPGIGSFVADSSVTTLEDTEKKKPQLDGIRFINRVVDRADDDLIELIKVQTGKMKPLAMSDLESYLTLGKQFLYIGKPFYLEGIGTLKLSKERDLEFIPGEYITTKLDDPNLERSEGKMKAVKEEDRVKQESSRNIIKKVLIAFFIIAVVGLLSWGAYYLLMNFDRQTSASSLLSEDSIKAAVVRDTVSFTKQPISQSNPPTNISGTDQFYKFVVETTYNKLRAINKYNFLRTYGRNVQLETQDSVFFKLYFSLPATDNDTLRIRDSLNKWYYGNTNTIRVRIE